MNECVDNVEAFLVVRHGVLQTMTVYDGALAELRCLVQWTEELLQGLDTYRAVCYHPITP